LLLECCFGGQEEDTIKAGETRHLSRREDAVADAAATNSAPFVASFKEWKHTQIGNRIYGEAEIFYKRS
jgi:hypothetical protein